MAERREPDCSKNTENLNVGTDISRNQAAAPYSSRKWRISG